MVYCLGPIFLESSIILPKFEILEYNIAFENIKVIRLLLESQCNLVVGSTITMIEQTKYEAEEPTGRHYIIHKDSLSINKN